MLFPYLMQMPDWGHPEVWVSLLTITFLEIVLGIDNIIFISIASNRLPKQERRKATNLGLILAMALRIVLLFGISYLIAMQESWVTIDLSWFKAGFSGQSLILILGGIFLLYKSTSEIHHKLEGAGPEDNLNQPKTSTLTNVILQITLINIIFSFDSILTAVGLTDYLIIMIIAVVLSVIIMMLFANPVGEFVNEHPTFQMLGLAFLILIGFMLITEGAHLAHAVIAGQEVGAIPKGYLYFAIAFSLAVEVLNMKLRKPKEKVKLHSIHEQAEKEGLYND
jgi:predicted tellurium resistance membrane protein TerC